MREGRKWFIVFKVLTRGVAEPLRGAIGAGVLCGGDREAEPHEATREKGTAPPPTVRAAGQEAEDVVSVELSEQACSSGFGGCCL